MQTPFFIARFSEGRPSGVCNFVLSGFLTSSNKQNCVHSKKKYIIILSKELVGPCTLQGLLLK